MASSGQYSAKGLVSQRKSSLGNTMKQLPSLRKGNFLSKGSTVQRLHPGMTSGQNRATAHYGAVTGLKATGDGMYLISSG